MGGGAFEAFWVCTQRAGPTTGKAARSADGGPVLLLLPPKLPVPACSIEWRPPPRVEPHGVNDV